MFSIVQNISSALDPVKADQPVGDKKHESDQGQNQEKLESDSSAIIEESGDSVLSVQAVIMFLEDFLEKQLESKRAVKSKKPEQSNSFSKWLDKGSANSNDASVQPKQAANVYAHTAKTTKNYVNKRVRSGSPSHSDLKDVYDLIRDLRQLRERGIFHLKIASDRAFLESIKFAVSRMGMSE